MRRAFTLIELMIVIAIIAIIAAILVPMLHKERAEAHAEKPQRFSSEFVDGCKRQAWLLHDAVSGKTYLVLNDTGIIEIANATAEAK